MKIIGKIKNDDSFTKWDIIWKCNENHYHTTSFGLRGSGYLSCYHNSHMHYDYLNSEKLKVYDEKLLEKENIEITDFFYINENGFMIWG